MTVDHYASSARRWADGASLVYGPIARQLVDTSPLPLTGRVVLDVGAGTGLASAALTQAGARPVATDLSLPMLAWQAPRRPPGMVADICHLSLRRDAVDAAVAAFVLNHLTEPAAAIAELMRVTRSGGAVLACVYANVSRSEVRDTIDQIAQREGWHAPGWYKRVKEDAAPLLGTADDMERAARRAGLINVIVDERAVDVGVTEPDQLVAYRLGQANYSAWLDQLEPVRAEAIKARMVEEIRPIMRPYRPVVVFLTASIP